jgi:hypothetical protein
LTALLIGFIWGNKKAFKEGLLTANFKGFTEGGVKHIKVYFNFSPKIYPISYIYP